MTIHDRVKFYRQNKLHILLLVHFCFFNIDCWSKTFMIFWNTKNININWWDFSFYVFISSLNVNLLPIWICRASFFDWSFILQISFQRCSITFTSAYINCVHSLRLPAPLHVDPPSYLLCSFLHFDARTLCSPVTLHYHHKKKVGQD